jgi:transposase
MQINRKTVAEYWNEYSKNEEKLNSNPREVARIQEEMISAKAYDSSKRKPHKYTEEIDNRLDEILGSEKRKDFRLGLHKQKLTRTLIHEILVSEGYQIGYSTIADKINIKLNKVRECFIKQQHEFGCRLEYDFGEVKLLIGGELGTYHLAVLSSPASNFRWAYLYKNQKKEAFLDSHVRFFDMVGGVYKEVVYDNMRNVVAKFIGRNKKELNEDLIKMAMYYGFDINVTNCYSGNEKGHVEGSVKLIRSKVFALRYRFESFEMAESHLQQMLIRLNEDSSIKDEKEYLLPCMPRLELANIHIGKVNKYSLVQIENSFYSVPEYLVEKEVSIKNYINKICIYANNHFVCEHKKIDGESGTSIDIRHYLSTLQRKPKAVKNSAALKAIPHLKDIFDKYFNTNPRKFIEILSNMKENSMEEIFLELEKYTDISDFAIPLDNIASISSLKNATKRQLAMYDILSIKGEKRYAN